MNPFDLNNAATFENWANAKLGAWQKRRDEDFLGVVPLSHDLDFENQTLSECARQIKDYNFMLYRVDDGIEDAPEFVKRLAVRFGLQMLDKNLCAEEDSLTKLTVVDHHRAHSYIPYTDKAIGWHTDGYYNPMSQRVKSFILHCEQPAASGGENALLDPDMVYIYLRRKNPEYIRALMQDQAMCIPANEENGVLIRPQTCSPVFLQEPSNSKDSDNVSLLMRFSKRKRHIIWQDDALTQEALHCLFEFLESDSEFIVRYRLNSGEGVVSNNVLHARTAFKDDEQHKRVYYRARFYHPINLDEAEID